MAISGADFEKLVEPYFRTLFTKMGFLVIQVRRQDSGTQNGFDISVLFFDENEKEREIFIECKYYTTSQLNWSEIFNKQLQLEASNQTATAFILLSPLRNLSNIDHDLQAKAIKLFKFPVEFWTPDKQVETFFAFDEELYKKVYDKPTFDLILDKEKELESLKIKINMLLNKKDSLKYLDTIRITDSPNEPSEDIALKTNLDEKLNSIISKDDTIRIEYHKTRANYKVYLESLQDLNTELRNNLLLWESDLRLKADRLTRKFKIDHTYTAENFFYDFFDEAEKEMLTFCNDFELKGDKQKLLNGVVFELAAQCPLDWRKNGNS
ncbi:restriction endonuclease [Flavobacterium panacagri]|uniref:restriction endonuclease n=1 Tax=Flavobacterium panacagri TaxID=3034146 RepID=UPI003EBA9732